MTMLFTLIIVLISISLIVNATRLDDHSFEPPFKDIDHSGERLVNKNWRNSGVAVVNNNFVRLTPDRQSKKGAVWARKPIGVDSVSSIFKFRISGQGKNFFGDGIALWFVQQGYYIEGEIHGFQEKFVGIGIIVDTFKNTERLSSHRDITILINDGDKTYEAMTEDVVGCNMNVRYHNDRADFTVDDSSRAKVVITANDSLEVWIDAKNSGKWVECATVRKLPFHSDWVRKAHIGMTATTGQLADNHDIISLLSYDTVVDKKTGLMDQEDKESKNRSIFEIIPELTDIERLIRLEEAVNTILTKIEYLDHHFEHEIIAVSDGIDNVINKLAKREDTSESRLEGLEGFVKKEIEGTLTSRLVALEQNIKGNVERTINSKISAVDNKMKEMKEDNVVSNSSGSWKKPFFFLFLLIVGGVVAVYFFLSRKMNDFSTLPSNYNKRNR